MGKLSGLFKNLRDKKSDYLLGKTGKDFEARIGANLHTLGFSRLIWDDIADEEKRHKGTVNSEILKKMTDKCATNPFSFKKHFILTPNGSQEYPDFLVLEGQNAIGIEAKYSSKKQRRPVWNSGLPRPNGIYIFGAAGLRDVTFFRGCDVINIEDAEKMHRFFKELKQREKQFNAQEMSKQQYGFSVYVRKAFDQKAVFNKEAIVDFFSNKNRERLENSVISYLDSL